MVRLPRLPSTLERNGDVEGDWVTIATVVGKLPPKDTVKGKKFVVWKLSDLTSQSEVVTLFLFGGAYQQHWKLPLGEVVALLNPSIMPSREVRGREGGRERGKEGGREEKVEERNGWEGGKGRRERERGGEEREGGRERGKEGGEGGREREREGGR